ncbi:MAG: hypothetical protein HYT87_20085 [Nitrospirae bacterium]|nr:hypothetical protein [Nitrospirota bacterium]
MGEGREGRGAKGRILHITLYSSLITAVLSTACGIDQGEPTFVDKPRILAMKAEPPEIQREGESRLSALVALPDDFDPSAPPPLLLWGLCELTGTVTGQSCADPESAKVLGAGGPEESIPIADPTPPPPILSGDGEKNHQGISAPPEFSMQPLPVPVPFLIGLFAKAGDREMKAFKRFIVSGSTNPNRNPVITDVMIDGAPLADLSALEPEREYTLEVQVPEDAAQSYADLSPTGGGREKTEDLFIAWFSTAEGLEKDRSFGVPYENKWRAPRKPPESGKVRFWVVLHDSREGVDWKSFDLTFAE